MAVNFNYLNKLEDSKLQLIKQKTDQKSGTTASIFNNNATSPEKNKQPGQALNNVSTPPNDALNNFFTAANKLTAANSQNPDVSLFNAPSQRNELMKKLIEIDQKDDGQINGSFLNDEMKTAELLEKYKNASSPESNKNNPEGINTFLDSLLQANANKSQTIDNGFLNKNVSESDKAAVQKNVTSSIDKTDLFRMLLQLDMADDGKANGSVFKNEQVKKIMDIVDDGIINNSSQNFINYITNKMTEDSSQAQKYDANSNYYNQADTSNPTFAPSDNIAGAYGLMQPMQNPLMAQVLKMQDQTNAIINSVNSTPYQAGQNYGSTEMKTDPNAPVNSPTAQQTQGTASGKEMAKSAEAEATKRGTVGRCYAGVADALAKKGVNLTGASAYMAADQLANNPKFKEVKMSADQLPSLPAGAVVVWGKTGASPHGHISVALGDGREASDHVAPQMTSLRSAKNCRVFMPV